MTLEQDHNKHQRPFRIRKSLRELVHKPRASKSSNNSALSLPPLPYHDHKCEEYAYDVLFECQRGSLAVGYSSKTLLQFDPNPWCDADMRFTPMNIENYQLPDPTWQWVSKDWMIDMTEDVDEAGWQYALKFHGAVWHGNYKHFRSFVRRRRWIRLRHRPLNNQQLLQQQSQEPLLLNMSDSTPTSSLSSAAADVPYSDTDIIEKLQKCRLDRERLAVLNGAIKSTLPGLEDQLLEKAIDYMDMLEYDDSKCKFLAQLLQKKYDSGQGRIHLTEREKKAVQSLRFYYDIQSILNNIDPDVVKR
ncbi:conserved hypothetical protein [Mucor ambiguus]|uniref:Peroxin/Ferlin domain-containing protein n=1 Tax=Mucor ambiguus TaxID=91626 RepID=A0A0C9LZX2_9FUNG|nr:conserved hypothetical protein [Mucor ambiguus]